MDSNSQSTRRNKDARTPAQPLECCDLSQPSPVGDSSPAFPERSEPSNLFKKPWPHAPVHKLSENGVYFVTGATLYKKHLFTDAPRRALLEFKLLTHANHYRWQIEAWAVFANHYHLVARGNPDSENLGKYLKHLHSDTARELNRLDDVEGRKVWYNFRDTKLTFETSYLARLNYTHQNAVKHGLVPVASQYKWCSTAGSSASRRPRWCRPSTVLKPRKCRWTMISKPWSATTCRSLFAARLVALLPRATQSCDRIELQRAAGRGAAWPTSRPSRKGCDRSQHSKA